MNRKSFLKGIALGTISLPVALRLLAGKNYAQSSSHSTQTVSGKRYEWKLVTTWPPNFPIFGDACTAFSRMVEEMSGGRMTIRVFGGGELVPALEVFDGVRSGAAEIGHGAAYYWAGKSAAAPFFSTVPFGMNAQQSTAWILSGGGLQLWESLYAKFNLIPMLGGNTGVQMGGWFNREINTIADLKGLKMRIPGLGGQVLAKAGGSPVLMAGGELYTSLERGVIDAAEWVGPYHDMLLGFQEIAQYYYTPGWQEPGTAFEFIFNKERFEALPADLQAILRTAATATHLWCFSEMEMRNSEAMATLLEKRIDIRPFPEEVIAQLRTYTEEVISEMVANDPFTQKVYESYSAFQKKAAGYAGITEKVFYNSLSAPI
ncbi:MAG: TRAP transporter substrate-binding protein [Haliscomenobacter sp.]